MLTPLHSSFLKTDDLGVKRSGMKRTPGILRAFKYVASLGPSNQGAPITSKGVSVPRPTERLVVSSKPTPGYKAASVRLRMLGEGLIQTSPVASNHIARPQPSNFIILKSALRWRSSL